MPFSTVQPIAQQLKRKKETRTVKMIPRAQHSGIALCYNFKSVLKADHNAVLCIVFTTLIY